MQVPGCEFCLHLHPSFLLTFTPRGGGAISSSRVSATHVGNSEGILGSWLQYGAALAVTGIQGVNWWVEDLCL